MFEAHSLKKEGYIDPIVYGGTGVKEKVIDQINALPTAEERLAYRDLLNAMLERDQDVVVNDIEDIVIPGIAPPLPGTDRAKTGAVRAVDASRWRMKEESGGASGVRATASKYTEGMALGDNDLVSLNEEEAAHVEARLKAKIKDYDTKKSLVKE
jgi:hypothetical protein